VFHAVKDASPTALVPDWSGVSGSSGKGGLASPDESVTRRLNFSRSPHETPDLLR